MHHRLEDLSPDDWAEYRAIISRYGDAQAGATAAVDIDPFLPDRARSDLRRVVMPFLIKQAYEIERGADPSVSIERWIDRNPELRDDPAVAADLREFERRLSGMMAVKAPNGVAESEAQPPGYVFVSKLKAGGMSRLSLVRNPSGELEVLKRLPQAKSRETDDRERFNREITLCRELGAAGLAIVPPRFVGELAGELVYTMPFCAGGSLRNRLDASESGRLSPDETARLGRAVAGTMAAFHSRKPWVIHRDLKPENILFVAHDDDYSAALVTDLGLAKVERQSTITLTGMAMGTPRYMSAEQIMCVPDLDARSDIHQIGSILYECLSETPAYPGASNEEVRARILQGNVLSLRAANPTMPEALDRIVLKCLHRDRDLRYPSAVELADDLDRFLHKQSVLARPPGTYAKLRSWAKRNRREAFAYGAALAMLVLATLVSTASAFNAAKKTQEAILERNRADESAQILNKALSTLADRVTAGARANQSSKKKETTDLFKSIVAVIDDLTKKNPNLSPTNLGLALNTQTTLEFELGEIPKAVSSGSRAIAALERSGDPAVAPILANAHRQMGVASAYAGELDKGRKHTVESIALYRKALETDRKNSELRFNLARAILNLGNFERDTSVEKAIAKYREAIAIVADLRKESPDADQFIEWEARSLSNLGLTLSAAKQADEALDSQRKAVALAETMSEGPPKDDALATCLTNLGMALDAVDRLSEAEPVIEKNRDLYAKLHQRFPEEVDYPLGLAMALTNLASLQARQRKFAEATPVIEAALKLFEELEPSLGKNPDFASDLAQVKSIRQAITDKVDPRTIEHPAK